MSSSDKQLQREQQQQWDARKRLDAEHNKARERKYATSSPYIRARSFELVEQYAKHIAREVQRRADKGESTGHFEALKAVVDRFSELEPLAEETYERPELGFLLIARTIWARVVDEVFFTGISGLTSKDPVRSHLSSKIGDDLERTLKLRYYMSLTIVDEADQEVKDCVLMNEIRYIMDGHGSLEQRRSRARTFLNEWDTGLKVVKKGRYAGRNLVIPKPFSWESDEWSNPWGDSLRELAAGELLDMLVAPLDGAFDADDHRPFYYAEVREGLKTPHVIRVRPQFVNELHQVRDQLTKYVVDWLPMIQPPLDWTYSDIHGIDNISGGYATLKLRQMTPIVRFGRGENRSIPSKIAVDFLNTIQSVEWRVNPDQLEIVHRISMEWDRDFDGVVRPKPWTTQDLQDGTGTAALLPEIQYREAHKNEFNRTKEQERLWKENNQKLSERYRDVIVSAQRLVATATMLARLEKLKGDSLWFPWSQDSRGRCYPIGGIGNPHGRPCERYTLEFAQGQRLNERGEEWGLRAIGAAANDTKGSVQSRIDWSRQNLDLIRQVAEGSDQALRIAESFEEPFNFVSLCRAWVQHEQGGLWHAPVYVDATNSGWQFVSALLGSKAGMKATNLTPSSYEDIPADAYKIAKTRILKWIEDRDADNLSIVEGVDGSKSRKMPSNETLRMWLEMLDHKNGTFGRSMVKAVATTAIYGSGSRTWDDDLEELLRNENSTMDGLDRGKFSRTRIPAKVRSGLATVIGRALEFELGEIFSFTRNIKAMARERLLQGCSDETLGFLSLGLKNLTPAQKVKLGQRIMEESTHGISWKTPDGSIVDVREYVQTVNRYTTLHHGKPSYPVVHTDSIDITDTLKAVPPGIIHSLDSSLIKLALSHLRGTPLNVVHDAVGGLPNDMDMITDKLRDGFLMAVPEGYIQSIADEWGVENRVAVNDDQSWRHGIHSAMNMFN